MIILFSSNLDNRLLYTVLSFNDGIYTPLNVFTAIIIRFDRCPRTCALAIIFVSISLYRKAQICFIFPTSRGIKQQFSGKPSLTHLSKCGRGRKKCPLLCGGTVGRRAVGVGGRARGLEHRAKRLLTSIGVYLVIMLSRIHQAAAKSGARLFSSTGTSLVHPLQSPF